MGFAAVHENSPPGFSLWPQVTCEPQQPAELPRRLAIPKLSGGPLPGKLLLCLAHNLAGHSIKRPSLSCLGQLHETFHTCIKPLRKGGRGSSGAPGKLVGMFHLLII